MSLQTLKEPLQLLFENYRLNLNEVKEIFSGERYSGVLLNNGNIGLCSGTGLKIPTDKGNYKTLNLKNYLHRVFYNAYLNAKINYSQNFNGEPDILKAVDFSGYKNVVMLGFIKPIASRLKALGVELAIFDLKRDEPELTPIEEREKYLAEADAIILSSTAIANSTFVETIENSKENAEIFVLGPSSVMAKELFEFGKVKIIFGSVFRKNDNRVIEIVKNDGGTREFLKFGMKKALYKK